MEELTQASHSLSKALYEEAAKEQGGADAAAAAAAAAGAAGGETPPPEAAAQAEGSGKGGEDVIDAEFRTK